MIRQRFQENPVNNNFHNERMNRVPDANTYSVCLEPDALEIFPVSDDPDSRVVSPENKGEDEKRLGPDGGWGWVVCAASFVVNFIVDGTMFCFGVLLVHLLDDFRESRAVTSWVGSAQLGMSMMMGPAVSALVQRFSIRQVTIAGTIVCALGFIASVFAPNIYILIVLYGVVAGAGFCAVYLPAVLAVGLYFNKKRAIATGIATSGSGVGTFAYGYVCDLLLWHYGWRHTLLILGAVLLNCVACGMVFRPLPAASDPRWKAASRSSKGGQRERRTYGETSALWPRKVQKEEEAGAAAARRERKGGAEAEECVSSEAGNSRPVGVNDSNLARRANGLRADRQNPREQGLDDVLGGHSDRNVSAQPSACTQLLQKNAETVWRRAESPVSPEVPRAVPPQTGGCWEDAGRREKNAGCVQGLRNVLGIQLFSNKTFLFLLLTFCMWTVQSVPLIFLPDLAISKGVPRDQAAFLISIVGLTNTISRAVAGLVTDVLHVRCIWLYVGALFLSAVVCCVLPLCQGFPALAAAAGVFGTCMAVAVSMRTIIIAEEIGVEMLTQSFGVVALFQGVFFMANPPMAGELFRQTNSYLLPFVMAGCMYLVSALSSLVVAVWLKPSPLARYRHTLTVNVEARV